ncbi:hypothetical protein [Undibacterium umbellatum]|uniref:Lysozyme inhibitor LprI N-terminal domain-containing protein n=1 Tax=Undibacterium umbellatum TaxID=2762300 RepID=A0ABR6Z6S8_9BURK|nr:hypothetical protein [Undibacterium umbellatum]MBC3907455.1 hypothetical protein [Undibacterium umbellatum]
MKIFPEIPHLGFLICLALTCASSQAAKISLDDCDLITAKPLRADFQTWLNKNRKLAVEGNVEALTMLAAEANNRLACMEEKITEKSGWSMTMSSGDGSSETTSNAGIPNIKKHADAYAALKDAVKYAHQAGASDPAYRGISAQLVLRYHSVLPEALETAYEDVAGANQLECVLKRKFGKRDAQYACASHRTTLAQLTTKIPAERRVALDQKAQQWAAEFPVK